MSTQRCITSLLTALLLATFAFICQSVNLRAADLSKAPGGSPPPPPAGFIWQPIPELTDEFNTMTLDAKKWQPKHPYWNGREPSAFAPANVSVKDGMLQLRSTAKVDSLNGVKDVNKDIWVASACVTSIKPLASSGYYAACMKASKLSMTSSFWFQGKFSEIDVAEQVGDSIKVPKHNLQMKSNTHYMPDGWETDKAIGKDYPMTTGSADAFHVYGVWWKDENTMWMFLDGQKVGELKTGGPFKEPQYMFFDTEVFIWDGNPTIESLRDNSRNTMLVDWVRGWKLVKDPNAPTISNQ